MKSVAVVSGYRRFKGSTVVARGYFEALRNLGYDARWYQCTDGGHEDQYAPGGRVIRGVSNGRFGFGQALNFAYFFPHRAGKFSEDLVLLTDQFLLGMTEANPGSLVVVHDLRELSPETRTNRLSPFLCRRLLRHLPQARGVLSDSQATWDDLRGHVSGELKGEVLPPGIALPGGGPQHLEGSLARLAARQPLRLLYVAVDRPYKHLRFLIELARHLRSRPGFPPFELQIVSELRPATQRFLERDPVPQLRVVPEVEDISAMYRASDALVFPSSFEGFGLPLVEAMGQGLPVLYHPAKAAEEVMGGAGLRVPELAVERWAEAIQELYQPARYRELATAGLQRASHYSMAAFQERLAASLRRWT